MFCLRTCVHVMPLSIVGCADNNMPSEVSSWPLLLLFTLDYPEESDAV